MNTSNCPCGKLLWFRAKSERRRAKLGCPESSVKLRRDGVLNLYPFPRVGRSSHRTWEVPINDLYIDYKPAQKRQLYAFPRVGRGDVLYQMPEKYLSPDNRYQLRGLEELPLPDYRGHGYAKRESESTDKTSMWFGPRLGRSQKDFETDTDAAQPAVRGHEEPDLEQYEVERKKRQTK
ncbi:hypothetical protein EVAR_10214_1 [Eumeta japonica]|uniref:Uncharacterized protein n=1 Tax=Eumeta variegata TaxID=151549 RepID=A0A4C1TDD8_EUMVA|nr:hypothetical protein EVAR_10214_1 [Eumeta japonica]